MPFLLRLQQFKTGVALCCVFSLLCTSCITQRVYNIGTRHEVYKVSVAEAETVYEYKGNYYMKGQVGTNYARTISGFGDKTYHDIPDSEHRDMYFRVDVGPDINEVKRSKVVKTINVLHPAQPGEFDASKARPAARVRLDDNTLQSKGYYIIPTGKMHRTAGGAATAYPLLPVAVVVDTVMIAGAVGLIVFILWEGLGEDDDDCCDHMHHLDHRHCKKR